MRVNWESIYMPKCAHIYNHYFGFVCACLSVCIFLHLPSAMQQAWGNSHLTSSAIPRSLRSVQQTMWGGDVTHPGRKTPLSSRLPLSLLPSLPFSLSVYQLSVCVPGFLVLTGWLESHSGTVAPRPKQDLMSKDTLFSFFPLPDGYHLPVCGHISVYVSLEMLIGCLQLSSVYTVRSCKDTFTTFISFFPEHENTPESFFTFEGSFQPQMLSHYYTSALMFKAERELFCAYIVIYLLVMHACCQPVSSTILSDFLHFPECCQINPGVIWHPSMVSLPIAVVRFDNWLTWHLAL